MEKGLITTAANTYTGAASPPFAADTYNAPVKSITTAGRRFQHCSLNFVAGCGDKDVVLLVCAHLIGDSIGGGLFD
ncbi:hypothetical protein QVD17_04597 [Tagetes erecta]|uniref:Uncharacterized protein n=1 Tax=Tagetes erecta TaxID=13708 RepID=A0AAD8LC79_TARER|nr:hypothetical protein QVD17_04597 [Tagetes erecta]